MKRIASLLFTAAVSAVSLTGCVVYDGYGYYEDDYYEDDYYRSESYRPARSYGSSYSTTIRYSSYSPDYVYWSGYYSALWPTYRYYYDPIFSPDFYYGVTYFPVSYFGIHYSRYQWPYYHAYSPYRYSYYDNYYDWRWRHRNYGRYDNYPNHSRYRFGSARNESERIAAYTGMDRYRGMASPGVQTQPYDRSHVFGWRNDGVQGHYPNQSGPRPFFQQANVDPMDWRTNQYRNRWQEPGVNDGVGRYPGNAAGEAAQIQRQAGGGWRQPSVIGSDGRIVEQERYNGSNEQAPTQRNNWREAPARESGWVSEAPPIRSQRFNQPSPRGDDFRPQRDTFEQRQVAPSQIQRDTTPRFEQPEPRFEGGNRFERYEQPQTQRFERSEQPQRFELPQRSEPRFERSEPRFEAPQRSEPRFEMPQRAEPRYEAPQRFEMPQRSEPRFERSEPRFEMPQRSEPRFERSEPRFEAPSRNDGGGSAAQESMRMSRGDDDER